MRDTGFKRRPIPPKPTERLNAAAKMEPEVAAKSNLPEPFPANLLDVEGLLCLFIDECLRSAPERRQPVYALAAGLAVVGTLAGRRYRTPTDLRSNVYTAVLGGTSSGKGHAQKVAQRLLHDAGLGRYLLGDVRSGAAIQAELVEHPSRLGVIDEVGIWIGSITSERAPAHLVEIKKRMTTLFSDANTTVAGLSYANPLDRARKDVVEPNLCLFGAGTPDRFFAALQSGALKDGFIPRLLVFRPDQDLPQLVEDPQPLEISDAMIEAARAIAGCLPSSGNLASIMHMTHDTPANTKLVPYSHDGQLEHKVWRGQERENILQAGCPGYAPELVGKWSEHAIKLGLIRAVSRDPLNPAMDEACVAWGWRVSGWCIRTLGRMADQHMADNQVEAEYKKVRNIIRDAGSGGIMKRDIIRSTATMERKRRDELLDTLVEAGEVAGEKLPPGPKGGRPGYRFRMATETGLWTVGLT